MGIGRQINRNIGSINLRRAVFLDRDGVINRAIVRDGKPYPPADLMALEILPGVKDAMTALRDAGWLMVVVTNQPDVARGITALADVEAINDHLRRCLPIDEFRACYHDTSDGCDCRKPSPGALLGVAADYDVDLSASYMVGDRWRDIEAGERAGCKTIFIDYGYAEKRPEKFNHCVHNLTQAVTIILGK